MAMVARVKDRVQRALGYVGLRARRKPPFLERVFAYRSPRALRRVLTAKALASTELRCTAEAEESKPTGELYRIWSAIPGGHKWHHYFPMYEELLGPPARDPIRLLEIGISRGGSLRMWREYLHPDATIVGIDIDPDARQYERTAKRVYCRIGDQSDPAFLSSVLDEFGPFDVIIDDGSHVVSHMVASFNHLFLDGLRDPGIYLAEDTHSNFWATHRDQRYSFIDFAKDLVDLSHEHYVGNESEVLFRLGHERRLQAVTVSRLAAAIEEIRFRDSVVVVRRRMRTTLPTCEHVQRGSVGW